MSHRIRSFVIIFFGGLSVDSIPQEMWHDSLADSSLHAQTEERTNDLLGHTYPGIF